MPSSLKKLQAGMMTGLQLHHRHALQQQSDTGTAGDAGQMDV